jgi:2'-5' RNA ligase
VDDWEEWQKPYEFGTIVIWPPDEVRGIVNLQRERYDPVSQSYCETHITVTQPLVKRLDQDEWDGLLNLLASYESFEITYGPLKSFLPYPCIWYAIQPVERVLELREALHLTGYFNSAMKHPENFIPHMTITEGQSGPTVDEALFELLQSESRDGVFQCDGLSYIVPDRQFRFHVERFLPLFKASAILGIIDGA